MSKSNISETGVSSSYAFLELHNELTFIPLCIIKISILKIIFNLWGSFMLYKLCLNFNKTFWIFLALSPSLPKFCSWFKKSVSEQASETGQGTGN